MIQFIQDYTTKSIPPETFTAGQEIKRSTESERYLVGLGVAGYLIDGKLVDQDHQPIALPEVSHVVAVDRRLADTGRGGEVLAMGTPPRATSGPGNVATVAHSGAEVPGSTVDAIERLRSDFEERMNALAQACETAVSMAAGEVAALRADLASVQADRDEYRDALAAAQGKIEAQAQAGTEGAEKLVTVLSRLDALEAAGKAAAGDEPPVKRGGK